MRENTAFIRPPRALWVPFDLGRPFGAPNDPAFQLDVLRSVLALLERTDGPVILDDFQRDAPGQGDPENMEGMVCPIPLKKPARTSTTALVAAVLDEIAELGPWQALFQETTGRSTLGVAKRPLDDAIRLLGDIVETGRSNSIPDAELGPAMRFATEDLRNFYLEAAAMRPGGSASTKQLGDWFWGETSAGKLVLALHPICKASPNPSLAGVVASGLLIPRAQQHHLAKST